MKLISESLLRQRNGLMIYSKIERVLVITKLIFNNSNTDLSLEITSKVQKVSQKYIFTHKLSTKRNFEMPSFFFSSTVKEWSAQDCGISKAAKDTGRVLMSSCHGMCSPKELWDAADVSPFKEIGAAPACLRVLSKTCLKETLGLTY